MPHLGDALDMRVDTMGLARDPGYRSGRRTSIPISNLVQLLDGEVGALRALRNLLNIRSGEVACVAEVRSAGSDLLAGDAVRAVMRQPLPTIRTATASDRDAIWSIFRAVVATGDTWFFEPTIGRDEALAYWFAPANRCFVAERQGKVVGTYILKPNHAGLGSHVANAGFMVAPDARGSGAGRSMAEHALRKARRLGFRAMQFNFVVSTNEPAVRLWQALGFGSSARCPARSAMRKKASSIHT